MTIRRPAYALLAVTLALLALVAPASASPTATRTITPGHSQPPSGGTTTTGQGLRPGNSNAQLSESIPSRVRRSWAASPKRGACPYNGSEDPEFSTSTTATNDTYTVALHDGRCSVVAAYRTETGEPVWSTSFPSAFALVSDGTYVYVHWERVLHDQTVHFISALKISSGKVRWTARSDAEQFELVVGSGVVVHGLEVFDAKTGRRRFVIPTQGFNSYEPRTLVVKGTLFRNNHDVVDAWTPRGKLLWRHTKQSGPAGPGAGELLPQYSAGRLYVPDLSNLNSGTLVLDARTGRRLRDLPHTTLPLAFDGRVAIFTSDVSDKADTRRLSAVDLDDGYVYWTRTYTGYNPYGAVLRTPPVIENGLVWFGLRSVGQAPMRLVALDEVTGATRARIAETCRLVDHDPQSYPNAGGTIGIAQHRLFVPSACGLQTYVPQR